MLSALTIFHVILSLIGIASGFVVLYGFFTSQRLPTWTNIFLWMTIATSVTGFFFPIHKLTPGIILGIISLFDLAIALRARNAWRRTYVITCVVALYLNMFVLVVQSFEKVPALNALAPTQSEPPFGIAQLVLLIVFIILGVQATRKFHLV
jgi:hypothetical protein